MGIAIRTGSPLSLNLAEPVWKQLAGMPLTLADLTEIDRDYIPGIAMCNILLIIYHIEKKKSVPIMVPINFFGYSFNEMILVDNIKYI